MIVQKSGLTNTGSHKGRLGKAEYNTVQVSTPVITKSWANYPKESWQKATVDKQAMVIHTRRLTEIQRLEQGDTREHTMNWQREVRHRVYIYIYTANQGIEADVTTKSRGKTQELCLKPFHVTEIVTN